MIYDVHELNMNTMRDTGRREIYTAKNDREAAQVVLSTKRLMDPQARLGTRGRTVYSRSMAYRVVRRPLRLAAALARSG